MIAVLCRYLGTDHLDLAENMSQEALIKALRNWPSRGIPANPAAWLMTTAKNLAIDHLRSVKTFHTQSDRIAEWIAKSESDKIPSPEGNAQLSDDCGNEKLTLCFVACCPQIPRHSQIALTLKSVCGFGSEELANAFMTEKRAIDQRLTRAKRSIKELGIAFEIPQGEELKQRLRSVLEVIYAIFTEGYAVSSGSNWIKQEMCEEALELGALLASRPFGNTPETHALMALMLFQASRLHCRTDSESLPVLLEDQDRNQWNRKRIDQGVQHLKRAMAGNVLSRYHLEAGIAACHATAASSEKTDWKQICSHYDLLAKHFPSSVVHLNRAVAIGFAQGFEKGVTEIERLRKQPGFRANHRTFASLGELHHKLGQWSQSLTHFETALRLGGTEPEQRFYRSRMDLLAEKQRTSD